METIRLAAQLPSASELRRLNKELRAGTIQLDWSAVAHDVTPEDLAPLLKGLIFQMISSCWV
ncbi:hypothetical protein [Dictyobacter vulcani]|uniref:hypothetical protein n=1 Tax=Dictyobacter vulcani TaxID=2607529 RepID=UPI0018EA25DE|nr:hypothetical protein [Dictyobacter vulcani]